MPRCADRKMFSQGSARLHWGRDQRGLDCRLPLILIARALPVMQFIHLLSLEDSTPQKAQFLIAER